MSREVISFVVVGDPIGKGSTVSRVATRKDGSIVYKNGRPVTISHDSRGTTGYIHEKAIEQAALEARERAGWKLLRGEPIEVWTRFYTRRPKSHYGTGRNADVLKPSAPERPITKPDKDKLERRVLDALTGVIYADDGQVVGGESSKWFAVGDMPAQTEIVVGVSMAKPAPADWADQLALAP